MNILVSACLLGVNCRYNGTGKLQQQMVEIAKDYHLVPICPEILGGLTTPRNPAEIVGDRVIMNSGEEVTSQFHKGAEEVLKLAEFFHCKFAILKENSPSCGYGTIYDGTFTKTLISGNGILGQLLSEHGITIIGESQLENFNQLIIKNTN